MSELADLIKMARGGESQASFGERLGVTQQTVSKWETGERVPRMRQLRRLASDYPVLAPRLATVLLGANLSAARLRPRRQLVEQLGE